MADNTISNFITGFGGGARANLFAVTIAGGPTLTNFDFHCKAASLPSSIIGVIPVNYRGRVLQIPGDRTFEDWTITIINEENMELKRAFIDWQRKLNDHTLNTGKPFDGWATATVSQLKRDGNVGATFTLEHVWCDNVSGTDVGWDTVDSISEFTVTMKYHNLTYTGTGTGKSDPRD